jgi:TrmH family RNA methyltransferase
LTIQNLIVCNDSKYFSFAKQCSTNGIDVSIVPNSIFNSISTLAISDGLIAVVKKPKLTFQINKKGKYVILDHIQNPGNLGTIIRTCVGFDIDGIIISNDSVDLFHPNIIRATMGACFSIPIKIVTDLSNTIQSLKQNGIKIYGTVLGHKSQSLINTTFSDAVAILFGNEGNGLKDNDIKLCDELIHIPISSKINSFNVSITVGIVLYQLCKQ